MRRPVDVVGPLLLGGGEHKTRAAGDEARRGAGIEQIWIACFAGKLELIVLQGERQQDARLALRICIASAESWMLSVVPARPGVGFSMSIGIRLSHPLPS